MNGEVLNQDVQGVSCTISGWLRDVGTLLQSVQLLLENVSPAQAAPPDVSALLSQLPPLIRECRAQIPTDRMVEIWVREVTAASSRLRLQPQKLAKAYPEPRRQTLSA